MMLQCNEPAAADTQVWIWQFARETRSTRPHAFCRFQHANIGRQRSAFLNPTRSSRLQHHSCIAHFGCQLWFWRGPSLGVGCSFLPPSHARCQQTHPGTARPRVRHRAHRDTVQPSRLEGGQPCGWLGGCITHVMRDACVYVCVRCSWLQ
jgi:hypothetical protein